MWGMLAVLLVVLTSLLGAGFPDPVAASRPLDARPAAEGVRVPAKPRIAAAAARATEAARTADASSPLAVDSDESLGLFGDPEPLSHLVDDLRDIAAEPRVTPGYQHTEIFSLPQVTGSPHLFRRVWGRSVVPSGRISLEIAAQIPVYDDRDFAPPELVAGVRLRF